MFEGVSVNFGDTLVIRDEIVRRAEAMGSRFEVRSGQMPYQRKSRKIDVTEPLPTTCKSCRKHGQGRCNCWFVAYTQFE